MIREKIAEFVRVNGFTYKSFVLSTFLCPPAAVYIAYKKPDIGVAQRVVLGIFGLLAAPAVTAALVYAVGQIVGFVRLQT